jgi:hypothetical protein
MVQLEGEDNRDEIQMRIGSNVRAKGMKRT